MRRVGVINTRRWKSDSPGSRFTRCSASCGYCRPPPREEEEEEEGEEEEEEEKEEEEGGEGHACIPGSETFRLAAAPQHPQCLHPTGSLPMQD